MKLSIKEKEYAISRASKIINDKYKPKIQQEKTLDLKQALKICGFTDKAAKEIGRYSFDASKVIEHHPKCAQIRSHNAKVKKNNEAIQEAASIEIQEAKDFIMLGDRDEVLDYIKKLSK